MIIDEHQLDEAAVEVARLNGISEELALGFLWKIGDTPESDETGRVIVRAEDGREIARIWLPEPDEE